MSEMYDLPDEPGDPIAELGALIAAKWRELQCLHEQYKQLAIRAAEASIPIGAKAHTKSRTGREREFLIVAAEAVDWAYGAPPGCVEIEVMIYGVGKTKAGWGAVQWIGCVAPHSLDRSMRCGLAPFQSLQIDRAYSPSRSEQYAILAAQDSYQKNGMVKTPVN